MARALVGYLGSASDLDHALVVAKLRRRISELELEVDELRRANEAATHALDLELHHLAHEAAPALT